MLGKKRKRLGDLLIESGAITEEQSLRASKIQKETGRKFGQVLIDENIVTEEDIIRALEVQMGIKYIDIKKLHIEPQIPMLINESLARKHELIPVAVSGGTLIVAMSDPLNIFAIDDVKMITGLNVTPVMSKSKDILSIIELHYAKQTAEKAAEDIQRQYENVVAETQDSEDVTNAPIVKLVSTILQQAIAKGASDIHIEPAMDEVRVRYRIDGNLQLSFTTAIAAHPSIVTRIKILCKLDIAEKRVSQDGRFEMVIDGNPIDLRVSTLPTVYGEKIVMRILYRNREFSTNFEDEMSGSMLEAFNKIIKSPNGMIVVTGPTGSGKSTTLYSILKRLNTIEKNIITIEDPVEYRLKGISQVQVDQKAGRTFVGVLRSVLRQDPDVVMIGEIRDTETAQIAVRAAITGHLVLSTMHTNDTASTVARLVDMGVEPFMVSSSVVGIVAQRLVRRICPECKTAYRPQEDETGWLGVTDPNVVFYKGAGCHRCGKTGYIGRVAVYEVMLITKELRDIINSRGGTEALRDAHIKNGMKLLHESGIALVLKGVTTAAELLRVAYQID